MSMRVHLLVSCEDEEDNAIKLTVNTSAYDVVKGLKSVDGNLFFTGELTVGLQLPLLIWS